MGCWDSQEAMAFGWGTQTLPQIFETDMLGVMFLILPHIYRLFSSLTVPEQDMAPAG